MARPHRSRRGHPTLAVRSRKSERRRHRLASGGSWPSIATLPRASEPPRSRTEQGISFTQARQCCCAVAPSPGGISQIGYADHATERPRLWRAGAPGQSLDGGSQPTGTGALRKQDSSLSGCGECSLDFWTLAARMCCMRPYATSSVSVLHGNAVLRTVARGPSKNGPEEKPRRSCVAMHSLCTCRVHAVIRRL